MNKPVDLNVTERYSSKVNWPNSYLFLTFQSGDKTLLYWFGPEKMLLPKEQTMEQ